MLVAAGLWGCSGVVTLPGGTADLVVIDDEPDLPVIDDPNPDPEPDPDPIPDPDPNPDPVDNPPDTIAEFELEVLSLVNARRTDGADCGSAGVFAPAAPLTMNDLLRDAARAHSTASASPLRVT